MANYHLLRNNKKSGPYTLAELVQIGLKPYDMVWVDGKSAAWQYPGEVEELNQYAAAVEQPYNKVFKKPGEILAKEKTVQPNIENMKANEYVPKNSAFVSQPESSTASKQAVKAISSYEKYRPKPSTLPEEPVAATATISIKENPVNTEAKNLQPVDEIKKVYVNALQQRKQKIARKALMSASLQKAAMIAAIVALIVLIGYLIKPEQSKDVSVQTIATTPTITESIEQGSDAEQDIPDETTISQAPIPEEFPPTEQAVPAPEKKLAKPDVVKALPPISLQKEQTTVAIPNEIISSTKNNNKEMIIDQPAPGVEVNAITGERNKKIRTDDNFAVNNNDEAALNDAAKPKAVMTAGTNLSKQVAVSSNVYQVVAFGGIRNLELTVTNDSKYILDNVVVELTYLKPNDQPLKSEQIAFRSVAPNGSLTLRVPDTNRGIKVTYKIISILSTQSNKELAGL